MRVLVLGGGGMLGHKLVQVFSRDFEVFTTLRGSFADYERFGIFEQNRTFEQVAAENTDLIRRIVAEIKPDVLVNGIGLVKQLPTSRDIVKILQINSIFPHQLATIAAENDARLITISTDCVFDGKRGNYTEEDIPDAADLYGKSKGLGEVTGNGCLTLRTSIIGRELLTRHSLLEWFLANAGKTVRGFTKAIYTGFPTIEIARILAELIIPLRNLEGLYHLSSEPITKFELLELFNEAYGAGATIVPDPELSINRSLNSSRLRNLTGFQPKSWPDMIGAMAADQTLYEDWKK